MKNGRLVALIEWSVLAVALALQVDLGAHIIADDWSRYQSLVALVTRGDVRPQDVAGAGYSLVLPLLAAPLYGFGALFGQPELAVSYFNLIFFLIAAALGYLALRDSLGPSTARRFLLLLFVATMFPRALQSLCAEASAAILVAAGLWGVSRERIWGWFAVALGCVATPALLVPLALVSAVEVIRRRRFIAIWPFLFGASLYLMESRIRRGGFFNFDYPYPASSAHRGFSNPLFSGIFDILFSFGKGLVFYFPALFLPAPLSPEDRRWRRSMLLFIAGMVLVYAKWWGWSGDWAWGPRFFVFASIPAALALAVQLRRPSLLTSAVLLLSLWVGLDGAIFGNLQMDICRADNDRLASLCQTTLEYSALWRPFLVRPPLGAREWMRILFWAASAVVLLRPAPESAAAPAPARQELPSPG
jgi:hypothetical protein